MSDIAIDNLSDTEARTLYEQLGFRVARQNSDVLNADETRVWAAICDVTGTRPAIGTFVRDYGKARFSASAKTLTDYMRKGVAEPLRTGEEQLLMDLIIRCLATWMKSRDIMVVAKSVLNSAEYAAPAVDRSFPGYARARMLGYLVQHD